MKSTALLVSLLLMGNGCSLLFVRPPRPSGGSGPGGCTTNQAAPVVDTIFASWQVVRIGIAAAAPEDAYRGATLTRESDMLIGVLLGLVGASSAIYGFRTTSECRNAGEYRNPYAPAPRKSPPRTREQRAADEAAEEAAVQARLKARAAEAAKAERDTEETDTSAPSVTPVAPVQPDAGP